jgi:CBS domain-containing protein
VHELLKRTRLKDLMEPVPLPLLQPESTLREVGRAFVDHGNDFFYVSSNGHTLEGIITITDLLRARDNGGTDATPAREFMSEHPVALSSADSCAVAAAAIREYRLKSLPVVDNKVSRTLAGCVRVRRLMAFVFKELGVPQSVSGNGNPFLASKAHRVGQPQPVQSRIEP